MKELDSVQYMASFNKDSRSRGSLLWPYVKRGKQHVSVLSSTHMKEMNCQNRTEAKALRMVSHGGR